MNTDTENNGADVSRSNNGNVRRAVMLRKTTEGTFPNDTTVTTETEVIFHGWTEATRCTYGDGSRIYVFKVAILEQADGSIEYAEPHEIRFSV